MGVGAIARPAVFLDRDGVVSRNVWYPDSGEWEGARFPADLVLCDGAVEAIAMLKAAGYLLILVSNQPNPAKGKASLSDCQAVHSRLVALLAEAGVVLDQAYYCYHHPHGSVPEWSGPCQCRKPSPYFLLRARDELDVNLAASWMVGDRDSDIQCGQAAGVHTVKIAAEHQGDHNFSLRAADLAAASRLILQDKDTL